MNSFLVLRLSALGDVVHTMPAVMGLRQSFGSEVRIGWLVEEPFAELVERVSGVDVVFRAATKRWRSEPLSRFTRESILKLRRDLRQFATEETCIDFQGLVKSALLGAVSGARRRVGFARDSIRESLATAFYTHEVSIEPGQHVVEWNLALARAAGAQTSSTPKPDYSDFAADPSGSLGDIAQGDPVILIPGAGRPEKQWNIDRFTILAERLAKLLGSESNVVVGWGPGERHLAESIVAAAGVRMAPPTNLRELAFLLRDARLVIAADTGPLHLADALGTRVVGLFGPTDPRRNGPYNQLDHCVESFTTTQNMEAISVDAVMEKVEEVLA